MNIAWQVRISGDDVSVSGAVGHVGYGDTAKAALADALNTADSKVTAAQNALDQAIDARAELLKAADLMFETHPGHSEAV